MTVTNIEPQITADPDAYRAWLRGLDEASRLALFGVRRDATEFRCPPNGRRYADDSPLRADGSIWTRCFWCDTYGRVRGQPGFDRAAPQPHYYPIVEASDDSQ